MSHEFSVITIAGFLDPYTLVKIRKLSRHYNLWITRYLLRTYGKTTLEDDICPECGDFINNKGKMIDVDDFYGLYLNEHTEMAYRYYLVNVLYPVSKREHITCDICFDNIKEFDEEDFKRGIDKAMNKYLRYRGDRDYEIFIDRNQIYSWAFLCYVNKDGITLWNEYKCYAPYR